jgi:hypothetical protein
MLSSFWAAVRSLLPLPVALKASPAARQLSLPPLQILLANEKLMLHSYLL